MASALLANRNEPPWGEQIVYMRKNSNTNYNPNPNPNPNNPASDPLNQIHGRRTEESIAAEASVSDDSSSPNQKSTGLHKPKDSCNGRYVTFNVAKYSRRELKDLKNRLILELEQVRELFIRIEFRESQSRSGHSASQFSGEYGGREITSTTPLPLHRNLSSVDSQPAFSGSKGLKERGAPKANQSHRASEFMNGKEKFPARQKSNKVSGNKRPLPLVSTREPKRLVSESVAGNLISGVMKKCGQILTKLMKHKHGWIFNVPVDVVGMGLHDYNQIIKHPMDLGTVKSKLNMNLYESPLDFATDVRLTFNNALTYNPKGHDVYVIAEKLLTLFEEMLSRVYRKYEEEHAAVAMEDMRSSSWCQIRTPEIKKKSEPARSRLPVPNPTAVERPAPTGKQPKPKAKEPNKRQMSYEEKQKLGIDLTNLPQETMDQAVQIIRRSNSDLAQNGDEIEVDIEAVDTETLWELDRFVSNCKKMMSKIKRHALVANQIEGNKSPDRETLEAASPKKNSKKVEAGEEDVVIDDEMPSTNFPPVEIEKDVRYGSGSSSSSSSSSDSSSSSNSDSGSSSENESNGNDAAET